MADDAEMAALRAELKETQSAVADLQRRMDHHDGELRIHRKQVETTLNGVKQVVDPVMQKAHELGAAQAKVATAQNSLDNLHGRVGAVEDTVRAINAGP